MDEYVFYDQLGQEISKLQVKGKNIGLKFSFFISKIVIDSWVVLEKLQLRRFRRNQAGENKGIFTGVSHLVILVPGNKNNMPFGYGFPFSFT